MRNFPTIKFGVRVPEDYWEDIEFDKNDGNELWGSVEMK